jgi:GNAT superfamily N-acetyltransferase
LTSDPRSLASLSEAVDLDGFDCGEPSLNEWLSRRAAAAEGETARTCVIVRDRTVLAYYCLCAGAIDRSVWPSSLRRNVPDPIPIILLGRLAVDQEHQGSGLARRLMLHAMRQSLAASQLVGSRALVVHALDESVAAFYRKLGFRPFGSQPLTLFVAFKTVAETLLTLQRRLQ